MTDVLDAIQALTPAIRARAAEIERARRLPGDLAQSLAQAGLFRMAIPKSIGGLELEPALILRAIEAAGAADASVGWCLMIGATSAMTAAYLPTAVAREIFGRADVITGGVFAPAGRATIDGDDYILDGRWQWASGSANCHWLAGGCLVMEGAAPRLRADGAPDERMLIFPAQAAELIDNWQVAGLCGTGSGDMQVRRLRVPRAHSVSLTADAPLASGALYAFPVFGLLALGIAAVTLGNARSAIDDLLELARSKKPQGSRRTLAERASAQAGMAMAMAEASLRSARAFFYEAVADAWAAARGSGAVDARRRAALRLAATHAARTSAEVTRSMHDLGGGTSVFLSSPLQRRFRDAHVATQHLMVATPTYELAGRVLMDVPTDIRQL